MKLKTKGTKAFKKDGSSAKIKQQNDPEKIESIHTEEYFPSSDSGFSSDEEEVKKSEDMDNLRIP